MKYSMASEEVLEWDDLIHKVARWVSADFPGVDREDIAQDVWVKIASLNAPLDISRPGVAKILERYAKEAAWKQRVRDLLSCSQYNYRPSDVRMILETVFDYADWKDSYVPTDARSHSRDDSDDVEVRADVKRAFARLSKRDQNTLRARYEHKQVPDSGTAASKRMYTAVDRLTNLLNSHVGPVRRRALPNGSALEVIRNQEE